MSDLGYRGLEEAVTEACQSVHSFPLSEDSGWKNALARGIASVCRYPCVLWVYEWEVFPSSGNLPMDALLRRGLGEKRPVGEAPVAIFDPGEQEELQAYVGSALQSVWSFLLIEAEACRTWFFSHDEYVDLVAKDEQLLQEAIELF